MATRRDSSRPPIRESKRRKRKGGFTQGGARTGAGLKPDREKRSHVMHLTDHIRRVMKEALEANEMSGRPLRLILEREMRRQPLKFLEVLSKFCPKDLNVKVDRDIFDELDDAELDGLLEQARSLAASRANPTEEKGSTKSRRVH